MKPKIINEIKAILLFAFAILVFLSLISYTPSDLSLLSSHSNIPAKNFVKVFGAYIAFGLNFIWGYASFLITVILFLWSMKKFGDEEIKWRPAKIIGFLVLLFSLSAILSLIGDSSLSARFTRAGASGSIISIFLTKYFGTIGAYIIVMSLGLASLILVMEILFSKIFIDFIVMAKQIILGFFRRRTKPKIKESNIPSIKESKPALAPLPISIKEPPRIQIFQPKELKEKEVNKKDDFKPKVIHKIGDYKLPSIDLLESPPPVGARQVKEDLESNARILEDTLSDFNLMVKVTDIERGPVITRYELEPAPGVKIQRIVSLSDDIALAMKAPTVRIVAPIPGKARVGIEVPNTQMGLVYLKEVLGSREFQETNSKISLALGKDIAGKPLVADLADMPHLLIAGTTGSGKTVCVNGLILSMLYRASPDDVKFIMVDPKMVELAPFNGLPHLICPVVTDAKKAQAALSWLVSEMEERYRRLAASGARNITAFNEKEPNEKMHYIVVLIDELADLMAVAANHIETSIARLAQLSRAVGIHLILATQRPSVDVITGVIKANFPARVSFQVASKVDSRTVLDSNGADKLLGRGDLLFLKPGEAKLIRAQGALVKDKEIERIVEFIKQQASPQFNEEILKQESHSFTGDSEKDELFDDAVKTVLESNQASVSILQRRMRLGYTRAARLIDAMERDGIVGPFEGSKPRKILIDRDAWLKEQKDALLNLGQENGTNR
ncbi:MAG: DNA translocase FtsK [Candidatus Omnitrophota bacterium]